MKTEKLHDRLGSVRQIIDTSGNVKNRYTYRPFGESYDDEGEVEETITNPFKFTGQYFDSEIDEYYLRARQYDPHIGRFTSRDSVFGKFKEPMTLHVYLYCLNDPVNRTDPRGEEFTYPGQLSNVGTRGILLGLSGKQIIGLGAGLAAGVMLMVQAQQAAIELVTQYRWPEEFKWGSKENVDWHIYGHLRGMEGDPEHRGKDPKDKWKRMFLDILKAIGNFFKS